MALSAPLAISMGEPAGIGGEILATAFAQRHTLGLPPFLLIGDPEWWALRHADIPVRPVSDIGQATGIFNDALPVLAEPLAIPATPGKPDTANAGAIIRSIERGTAAAMAGDVAGLVTLPIQKATLAEAGFAYPGHTEFLAALASHAGRPRRSVMMLSVAGLRVVPVTVHVPLAAVPTVLDSGAILETGRITAAALRRDFGLAAPRLAVAGLNPHAGENGLLGSEEHSIIGPVIAQLRAEGITATGPHSPDTLFHAEARAHYDAALCMYHDQALIPLKTLDFYGGVNITLGLPFVRTSPDHGTALDLAGSGKARPESLIAALRLAAEIASNRAMAR